ncbi:MAG TPA: AAA family ATPase [Jatrophihabitans sp.]|nr:AAA family ATPase [Jatrophihabitans sp.]
MLTPARSLSLNADAGRELPRVEAFEALYHAGVRPRHGQVIMIAGRSGTQKSGFALYWVAQMNLPTLYFSADMSAFTASSRLACMFTGDTTEMVEAGMAAGDPHRARYLESLADSRITFSFGSPINWHAIDQELEAYIELWDAYPEVMVFDNLMDFDGAESDYTAQMEVMSLLTELARNTGATIFVLHHASDKSWEAKTDPWRPPSRDQVKGGLSEKPELSLSVALDPTTLDYNIACIKQRMGPCDPTAGRYVTLRADPERTRFHKYSVTRA